MADMESICARLSLLTRAAWKDNLPTTFTRASVSKMIRLGALEGLALRKVPNIKDEYYTRAEALLVRSHEIFYAVEHYRAQGYRVLLPEDDEWPVNLHALGMQMPQFLFASGNLSLLNRRCVSVSGSRDIKENTMSIACEIGEAIARQGLTLVCGGARGVDTAVQRACIEAGGTLILIPSYPCKKYLCQEYLCSALREGRLLLLCDTWPAEGFSTRRALARNHIIYALGDAAIAVASRNGKGGTWHGACDCLLGGYTPVFAVNEPGLDSEGNQALIALGAKAFERSGDISLQLFAEGGMDE